MRQLLLAAAVGAMTAGVGYGQCVQFEVQRAVASDGQAGDAFGLAVVHRADEAWVGAPRHDDSAKNAGAVYVFERVSGTWSEVDELLASDGEQGDRFGERLAQDGDDLMVAAPFADSSGGVLTNRGAVYVFQPQAGTWLETQILTPPVERADQLFGHDVEVDGDWLAVGAPGDDQQGTSSGAVFIYRRVAGVWVFDDELRPADIKAEQEFGYRVALRGDVLVVGSPCDGPNDEGAGYVFRLQGGTWLEEQKLVPSGTGAGTFFGDDVAFDGTWAFLSSPDFQGTGCVVPWSFDGVAWNESAKLLPSDGTADDEFGASMAASNGRLVVGSPGADTRSDTEGGAAYLYRFGGTAWVEQAKLEASDAEQGDLFGLVSLEGDTLLIGAVLDEQVGSVRAYDLFDLNVSLNGEAFAPSDPIEVTTCGVVPGSLVALYTLTPIQLKIALALADAEGRWSLGGSVPPGLSGLQVTLQSFGFPRVGELGASNVAVATFL